LSFGHIRPSDPHKSRLGNHVFKGKTNKTVRPCSFFKRPIMANPRRSLWCGDGITVRAQEQP